MSGPNRSYLKKPVGRPALAGALVLSLMAGAAHADAPIFIVDQTQLPFDLSPANPANSPSSFANSPQNAANSASNLRNTSRLRETSPTGPNAEQNLIFTTDGVVVGYYMRNGRTLNLFDGMGKRVVFRPANRATKSLFSTNGEWCGTVAETNNGFALGLTRKCARFFGLY